MQTVENKSYNITYDSRTLVDGGELVSSTTFNGLVFISNDLHTVKYITSFKHEPIEKNTLHHKQYRIGNNIYFMPDHSKRIHIYSLIDRSVDEVPFFNLKGCTDPIRGVDSFRDGNYIWIFFEYAHNPIIKFDTDNNTINNLIFISNKIPDKFVSRGIPVFNSAFSRVENKAYAAVWKSNYIFEFDLKSNAFQFIKIDVEKQLKGVAVNDNKECCCIFFDCKDIFIYSLLTKEGYWVYGDSIEEDITYSCVLNLANQMILISENSKIIYFVSQKKIIEHFKLPQRYSKLDDDRKNWRNYFSYEVENNEALLCPYGVNLELVIDIKNNLVKCKDNLINENLYMELKQAIKKAELENIYSKGFVKENKKVGLNNFINLIDLIGD